MSTQIWISGTTDFTIKPENYEAIDKIGEEYRSPYDNNHNLLFSQGGTRAGVVLEFNDKDEVCGLEAENCYWSEFEPFMQAIAPYVEPGGLVYYDGGWEGSTIYCRYRFNGKEALEEDSIIIFPTPTKGIWEAEDGAQFQGPSY